MTKVQELREMADEQIRLVWKDAAEKLFRLRIQAQTEKIAAPSDLRKNRRTIARCQTILAERGAGAGDAAAADAVHGVKRSRRHGASGRAKVRAAGKGGVASGRSVRKRTQSGK